MNKKMSVLVGLAVISSIVSVQAQTGTPIPLPTPGSISVVSGDIIQFNNLVVQNVSGNTIWAYPNYVYAQNGGGGIMRPMEGTVPASGAIIQNLPQTKCVSFKEDASRGKETKCPAPSASAGAPNISYGAPTSVNPIPQQLPPETYPMPSPYLYRIEVSSDTRLLLRNRMGATLADFSSGDQINVFGYYANDGSIRALIVRNLSKPEEKQFIQLDNTNLVSVSGNTLIVVQRQNFPCYGFNDMGEKRFNAPCPLGAEQQSPTLRGVQVPSQVAPYYDLSRKYVVQLDAQTIILDRNRSRIGVSDLSLGDQLNIYGVIGTDQVIEADIVRDTSKPAKPSAPETIKGTVTQVNADGSFVMQTSDGRSITVSEVNVGAEVTVRGILDEIKNFISQVTEIKLIQSTNPPRQMITITGSGNLAGTLAQPFYATFKATGGISSYGFGVTAGSIPPGLSLAEPPAIYCFTTPCPQPKEDSIVLQGTPTQAGTYKFTLTAKDQRGNIGNETFVIVINPGTTAR